MNIEQYLKEKGTLTYTHKGTSMMPLLREGIDMFTIRRKGPERCRRGDVVLYVRYAATGKMTPSGVRELQKQYVLHRVIEVRENDYVILGDNCTLYEYGITDSDIIGVMTEFIRDGKLYSVDCVWYRLYTFLILHTKSIRIIMKKVLSWMLHRR